MESTAPFLSLSLMLYLALCLSATATATTSSADIDGELLEQALFYRNNRQLVTVEITKSDNTKVDISSPFMGIELEQSTSPSKYSRTQILTFLPLDTYLGLPPITGVSAQITHSAVTNFTISDILCILYDIDMQPLTLVSSTPTPITKNNTDVEIYGVGCGTPNGVDTGHGLEERYNCFNCCAGRIYNCIFSVFVMCFLNHPACG
jgi:hypothetical protein